MDYLNSKFTEVIRERIHHERDREIMFLHFVQGRTYEELAQTYSLSSKQIGRICNKRLTEILKYLNIE